VKIGDKISRVPLARASSYIWGMRFPPSVLDEIRARLSVSEVVGKRVRLQKAGREWKGLSPFNAEKTPSFFVNDQKGFYHDFSSGKHGDIFTFLMETEGVAFPEAVEKLAGLAGVPLPVFSQESLEREDLQRSLGEALALAGAFFQAELRGRRGAKARGYLEGRGLGSSLQERFGLGYAPGERHGLRDHLAGKGVSVEQMVAAGLLVHGDDIPVAYDRFRDRVMFPICDVKGRVIAFGGRALEADVAAKYLNGPETELFHKGSMLFNHHNARKAAHDQGTVIAVEGYIDVISMSVTGFPNTVAPLGTALTPDQLALLWRMADEPILCFDGDKAGRRAAYRAIDVALPLLEPGKSLRFALLAEGQDPDDLARRGGEPAIRHVLDRALPLADLLFARETEGGVLDTPERRAALERRLHELVSQVAHEGLRRHYRDDVTQRLRALFRPAPTSPRQPRPAHGTPREPRRFARQGGPFQAPAPVSASENLRRSPLFSQSGALSPREALILSLLVAHPDLLLAQAEDLATLDFGDADARLLRQALVDWAASARAADPASLRSVLASGPLAGVVRRVEAAVRFGDRLSLASKGSGHETAEILKQALTLHRRALTLHNELKAAERALAEEGGDANLAWMCEVQGQLQALDGTQAESEEVREAGGSLSI
jgi:DNA primase